MRGILRCLAGPIVRGVPGRGDPGPVRRAVSASLAQAMVGAIYAASTGGMFLIGYALRLGATDAQIGLLSTVPMLCIGVQLVTAALVERGWSRRRLTFVFSLLNVSGWGLIILIPYAAGGKGPDVQVSLLIGVITLVTLFGYAGGNARGSWVGDLIPARFRGTFFGRLALYGGLIAALFAIGEGGVLDVLKHHGLGAFSALFGFGMLFGLINACLFLRQDDVPLVRHEAGTDLWRMVRETFANRSLMVVGVFAVVWSMQLIAGPFYATYQLGDLHMPFVGIGIVNAFVMVAFLASGPFWGRAVGRWGCRPVLTFCAGVLGPLQLVWLWVDSPMRVYTVIATANPVAGFVLSGVNVAMNTLVYKVTPAAGRSVQFAVYSIVVVLLAAPMPAVGGRLPGWLHAAGLPHDLRFTFYTAGLLLVIAAIVSRRIREPDSRRARDMVRALGNQWLLPLRRWRPWEFLFPDA